MNMTKESCSIMIIIVPPFHTFPRLGVYSTLLVLLLLLLLAAVIRDTTRHETVVAFLP